MPLVTPLTTPVVETVATDVLLLAHVPDEVPSDSVTEDPVQTDGGPLIAAGAPTTNRAALTVQPVPSE